VPACPDDDDVGELLLTAITRPVGTGCVYVLLTSLGWFHGVLARLSSFDVLIGFPSSFSAGGLHVFVATLCGFLRMLRSLLAHLTLLSTSFRVALYPKHAKERIALGEA